MRILHSELEPIVAGSDYQLSIVRQVSLLQENEFIRFCSERGMPTSGVIHGDPGTFYGRGWLAADQVQAPMRFDLDQALEVEADNEAFSWETTTPNDELWFHPFRIWPLHRIYGAMNLGWARSSVLEPEGLTRAIPSSIAERDRFLRSPAMAELTDRANGIADLATLLEPVYWPWISSRKVGPPEGFEFQQAILENYRYEVLALLNWIDPEDLRKAHEELRIASHWLDRNDHLYLALRTANWDTRKRLEGRVGAALWLRHMAELIRRGTEEVYDERFPEEDEGFGWWLDGARERFYGSNRPLDDPSKFRKDILRGLGLDTAVKVRWYVEGETELGALLSVFRDPIATGVEIFNLRAALQGKNAAMLIAAYFGADIEAKRFTFFSLDTDGRSVCSNGKTLCNLARQDLIVGVVSVSDPDFEFANFTLDELIQVAIEYDREDGFDSRALLEGASWSGVANGKSFDQRYVSLHGGMRRELKGERWGKSLMNFALQHPERSDGAKRPILWAVQMARRSHLTKHDDQRSRYRIDTSTLQIVERV